MPTLNSRSDLIQYSLRKLGAPVIKIDVDYSQIEDAVDDAIQYFQNYATDAVQRFYYKHQLTSTDITNLYIDLNDTLIISVIRIFPIDTGTQNIFSFKYQFFQNDMYNLYGRGTDLIDYQILRGQLDLLDFLFQNAHIFRFNRHENRVYLDTDASQLVEGDWIVFECWRCLDMTTFRDTWNDIFLKSYTPALIKKQWGQNLKKFGNIQLPGGVVLNGQQIYDEASQELETLEEKLKIEFQQPPVFLIG